MPKRKSRNQSLKQRVKALEMRVGKAKSSAAEYMDASKIDDIYVLWKRLGAVTSASLHHCAQMGRSQAM